MSEPEKREPTVWLQAPAVISERQIITHATIILNPDGSIKVGVPKNRADALLKAGFEVVEIVDAAS
jgi:hypothetical protein